MQRPPSPTRRARRWLAVTGVAVLTLAACGGDDDDDTAATDAPTATEAPGTTDAPAATDAPSATEPSGTEPAAGAATVAVADSSLGEILVDGAGMTLYMFVPDAEGPSTCVDGCLEAWPAIPGPATAGDGVDASLLATAPRPDDGSEQATCAGWPLYTFVQDTAPGDVTGQDSGEKWYVLDATCTPVGMEDAAAPATTAAAAPDATTGATVGLTDSSLGQILVDGDGMTLYMFAPDAQGPSTCVEGCLEAWPMVHAPATAGDGVDASLLASVPRPEDETPQATCDGWPLYTFVQDAAPGDVTGQGSGDKWYVLDATCTPIGM